MPRWTLPTGATLEITRGDLTRADVDAVVNAANSGLLGGGGVDGAIHRAAGPALLDACRRLPRRDGMRCPPGEARITPGFDLPARHVIHTVGPVYHRAEDPAAVLAAAHRSSLALARAHGLRTVAFPAISCGVYGYPPEEAADVALETCLDHGQDLDEIRFVMFGPETFRAWCDAAEDLFGPPEGR